MRLQSRARIFHVRLNSILLACSKQSKQAYMFRETIEYASENTVVSLSNPQSKVFTVILTFLTFSSNLPMDGQVTWPYERWGLTHQQFNQRWDCLIERLNGSQLSVKAYHCGPSPLPLPLTVFCQDSGRLDSNRSQLWSCSAASSQGRIWSKPDCIHTEESDWKAFFLGFFQYSCLR